MLLISKAEQNNPNNTELFEHIWLITWPFPSLVEANNYNLWEKRHWTDETPKENNKVSLRLHDNNAAMDNQE